MTPFVKKVDYAERWCIYTAPHTPAHWGGKMQIFKTREEAEAALAAHKER
jgi:hypothetical protein